MSTANSLKQLQQSSFTSSYSNGLTAGGGNHLKGSGTKYGGNSQRGKKERGEAWVGGGRKKKMI